MNRLKIVDPGRGLMLKYFTNGMEVNYRTYLAACKQNASIEAMRWRVLAKTCRIR